LTQSIKRPIGVTIIATLTIISGALLIFGGLAVITLGAFFVTVHIDSIISEQELQQELPLGIQNQAELEALIQFLAGIGIIIGSIVLAVGIGYLIVSYGLLKGKEWAWIVTVILTIIAIAIQIISVVTSSMFNASFSADMNALISGIISHIIGLAINGVILYYLYRPHVKSYFGKSKLPTNMPR
jgi:hypothetical protein